MNKSGSKKSGDIRSFFKNSANTTKKVDNSTKKSDEVEIIEAKDMPKA